MPIFACSRCETVENTALGSYWMPFIKGEAVIVPKKAPLAAVKKGMAYYGTDADKEALGAFLHVLDISLSASPYAVEKNGG